jgi:uncharacterized membrane protein YccC
LANDRGVLDRIRAAYTRFEGRAAPFYGLASALAVAVPLLVGSATGQAARASAVALGAFLVAIRAPEGPYSARARNLASAVLVVAVGALVGGTLAGRPWTAVLVVPPIVALGTAVPAIGPTAGLAVLLTAIGPSPEPVLFGGFLEVMGALLATVLYLAPWPTRRLRPLRTTLADAAEAVANALDAVAEELLAHDQRPLEAVEPEDPELLEVALKPDWEEARLAAFQALATARDTSQFYRTGRGRSDPTRPERLIEALERVMQETVALRSLVEAALRAPPVREWEQETRIAITSLAARVRLIAGEIAITGETPMGGMDSAALRRMGRQIEAIRRAGLAGDEDTIASVTVAELRRSIERLAGTVHTARRLAAGGVHIGFGPPRLLPPAAPGPATIWERLGRAVRTRSPGFREVTAALDLPHGHWMTITAMLSIRGTYGETVEHLLQRVGGTAVGCAVAAVLLTLLDERATIALIVFVIAFAGFTLRTVTLAFWWPIGTPLAMLLLDFAVPSDWGVAAERIGLTLAGGALAFLAVRLLWPAGHADRLPLLLGRMIGGQATLARATADVVENRLERLPPERITAAEECAAAVSEAEEHLAQERLPADEQIDALVKAAAAAHRVRDHLIAIARMIRKEEVDAGPLGEILSRLADAMEEAADALDDPDFQAEPPHDAPSPGQRLDEEFARLETHLAALSRRRLAEIQRGVDPEATTPLRRALWQASTTRHAVRSLRGDIEELIGHSQTALHAGQPSPPPAQVGA